ncbi:threonine--tRNA ligase [bacterium]|nr:threonine--tRNA ligase [bacterium]
MIKVKLPDGSILEMESGSSALDVAKKISSGLAKEAVVAVVNGEPYDLTRPLPESGETVSVEIKKFDDREGRETFWHSTAHIMAHAVKDLFPDVKVAIGPAIDEGFYYDFDKEEPFTPDDLVKIEKRMAELVKENLPFVRKEISRKEAYTFFAGQGESYKLELLEAIPEDETVSLYTVGDFVDLCRGPHLPSSGLIKHFKLVSIAGAYWRGDERNKALQRIYGVSYPKKSMLEDYIERRKEAQKRDHRKLGKELDLFIIDNEVGPGLVLWTPNGAAIREVIEDFWRKEHRKNGYHLVFTPHLGRDTLWQTSGHLAFYQENMYAPMEIDEQRYFIKPMNCPFHIKIYQRKRYSYRELPLRWAELGTVYRYERSGVLGGLLRVRGFTQDDAHIICRADQVEAEILRVLKFSIYMLKSFGFEDFHIYLSTKPAEKFVGDEQMWELAQNSLKKAIEAEGIAYDIDEGGGAFYGPKIDIKVKDALRREWQLSTIQFDFNLPERFDMVYTAQDGTFHRPYMIHRALLGSLERFFATLIEHWAGNFPLWLAPVQVIVLPVSDKHNEYARKIYDELFERDFRVEIDDSDERIGYKIRAAENRKIPYMIIVGAKEEEANNISVRKHLKGDIGSMTMAEFIEKTSAEIKSKK